jgi:hypothetical protein
MTSTAHRALLLLPGPIVGVSLVALSVLGNSGPGFLYFSLAAAFGFVLVAPAIQLGLYRTNHFSQRRGGACVVSLFLVTCGLLLLSRAPVFNQW